MQKLRKHLNVEFEVTPDVPIQESTASETQSVSATNALPKEMADRLKQALKIKNLTAIKGLAAELIDDPTTNEIGQKISELASSFDFTQLTKLLNELENPVA